MENRIVCHCLNIDLDTIKKAVEAGADTLEKVQEATEAGTICGACCEEIEVIIEEFKK